MRGFSRAKVWVGASAAALISTGAVVAIAPPAVAAETVCGNASLSYTMTANLEAETAFTWHQNWPGGTVLVGSPGCQVKVTQPSKRILEVGGTVNGDSWAVEPAPGSGFQSASLGVVDSPNCTAPAAIGYVQANRPSCTTDLVTSNTDGNKSTAHITISVVPNPVLSVTLGGQGGGSVVSSVAGINCGTDCLQQYPNNTTLTLTATASLGSSFSGWSGAPGCGGSITCGVTMNQSRAVTAVFVPDGQLTLTVVKGGTGTGTITSSPAGINCNAACSEGDAQFALDLQVVLTATPSNDSTFVGWGGGQCTGTAQCIVTMSGNRNVTANFALKPVPTDLTVTKNGSGGGTVTSTPTGIDCGSTCTGIFDSNSTIDLTATADPGSRFVGWSSGGCTGTGQCSVILASDTEVFATFAAVTYQPDGRIGIGKGKLAGDNVYNGNGKKQTKAVKAKAGKTVTFSWSVQNDGDGSDKVALSQSGKKVAGFKTTYFVGKANITKKVTAGTYAKKLAAGAAFTVTVKVKLLAGAKANAVQKFLLKAASKSDAGKKDVVGTKVTALK